MVFDQPVRANAPLRHTRKILLLPLRDEICPMFLPRQMADQVLPVQHIARLRKSSLGEVVRAAGLDASFQLRHLSVRGSR